MRILASLAAWPPTDLARMPEDALYAFVLLLDGPSTIARAYQLNLRRSASIHIASQRSIEARSESVATAELHTRRMTTLTISARERSS